MADVDEWQVVQGLRRPRRAASRAAESAALDTTSHVACCSMHRVTDEVTNLIEKAIRRVDKSGLMPSFRKAASEVARKTGCLLVCCLIGLGNVADASDSSAVWAQLGIFFVVRNVVLGVDLDVSKTDNLLHTMNAAAAARHECRCVAFDPAFTDADIILLARFGITAVAGEGSCPCLGDPGSTCVVVSPHVPRALDSRLLWQHWQDETQAQKADDGTAGLSRLIMVCNSLKQHVSMELSRRASGGPSSNCVEHDAVVALLTAAPWAVHERPFDACLTRSACRDEDVRSALQNPLSNISIHTFPPMDSSGENTLTAAAEHDSSTSRGLARRVPYKPGKEKLQAPPEIIRET